MSFNMQKQGFCGYIHVSTRVEKVHACLVCRIFLLHSESDTAVPPIKHLVTHSLIPVKDLSKVLYKVHVQFELQTTS